MARKWFFDPLIPHAYDVINIDPPTYFKNFSAFESAKGAQYPTMDDSWIASLPINDLSKNDCLLFMWSTMPKLDKSIEWMEGWGFKYKTAGPWIKKTKNGKQSWGTGYVLRSLAEIFLIGTRGKPRYQEVLMANGQTRPNAQPGLIETEIDDQDLDLRLHLTGHQFVEAENRGHSRKPDIQYELIEALMEPGLRCCELFARQTRPGWEAWGNQVDHFEPVENS